MSAARFALPAALALSLAANGVLLWMWGSASTRAEGEIATAFERGRAAAAELHIERQNTVLDSSEAEAVALLSKLEDIAERGQATRTVYRDRVRELPAPTCAPGVEFMDAANALIGGEQ